MYRKQYTTRSIIYPGNATDKTSGSGF